MNHLQIAYFLAVARCRSFSEAARQLYVAQSAVSKQIQAMETSLGIQLFVRTNRTVALTPAGEMLYRELQKHDSWIQQIIDMARQIDRGKAGVLNIGVLHGLNLMKGKVHILSKFLEMYPGIQVNIQRIKLQDVTNSLSLGTHDIIIAYSFLVPDRHNIGIAVMGVEEDQIVVSCDHPIGKNHNLTANDFRNYPLITIAPEISRYAYLNSLNYLTGIGVSPAIVNHVPTIEDIMLSVEVGLGYGISSESSRLSNNSGFRFINMYEGVGCAPKTELFSIWSTENKNPAVQFYIDYLKNEQGKEIRYGDSAE